MGREHLPIRAPSGALLQSGIPKRTPLPYPLKARGLILRGVVVATYVVDDGDHPGADGSNANGPRSVYCDVIAYSSLSGMRWRSIPQCLVRQDRGGIHDGGVWKPRAATKDITGGPLDPNRGSNPANWDGDHVLIGFIDDSLNLPVILGGIPHPNADAGVGDSSTRQRLQLKVVDGDPRFVKHHGSHFGIDGDGNWLMDSRFAHGGELEEDGSEPAPPTDGKGSHTAKLPLDASHAVVLYDMTDPENPDEKVHLTITKDGLVFEMVEDKTVFTITKDTVVIDVEDGANPVTVTDGEIQLGGDDEEATVDSKLQTELSRVKDDVDNLKWELGAHRHPLPEWPFPLMFGDILELFAQPAVYIIKTQPPINLRTGAEVNPGSSPMDKDASIGEYFGVDIGPTVADLFTGGSDPGDTASDLVTFKS